LSTFQGKKEGQEANKENSKYVFCVGGNWLASWLSMKRTGQHSARAYNRNNQSGLRIYIDIFGLGPKFCFIWYKNKMAVTSCIKWREDQKEPAGTITGR